MTTTTATNVLNDAFGNAISEGDLLVFAVRQGSSMWLNKLRVLSVTATSVTGYDPADTNQRKKTLRQNKTIVIIPEIVNEDGDIGLINNGTNHELAS